MYMQKSRSYSNTSNVNLYQRKGDIVKWYDPYSNTSNVNLYLKGSSSATLVRGFKYIQC